MSTELFYNTNFNVKYHQIECELTQNYKQYITTSNQEDSTNEHYTHDDIEMICNKLYRDEFCSVFYSDNPFDDKIDSGIHTLRVKMEENHNFSNMMAEIKNALLEDNKDNRQHIYEEEDNNYIIFLSLFSYNTFYLMHKIVCEYILTSSISKNLLDELKLLTINQLKQY